jgi:hypothetical protein
MANHDYKTGRYEKKYTIQKADGSPADPQADYFVLRIDEDPHARKALAIYAESLAYDNPLFAYDILVKLRDYKDVDGIDDAISFVMMRLADELQSAMILMRRHKLLEESK